jgi:hypothetical protein
MCYLIVSFAYNIRYKPGFSERAGDEYREAELRYFEEAQWDEIRNLDCAGLFDAIKCARSAALKIIDGITRKGLTPVSGKLKVDKRISGKPKV